MIERVRLSVVTRSSGFLKDKYMFWYPVWHFADHVSQYLVTEVCTRSLLPLRQTVSVIAPSINKSRHLQCNRHKAAL